MALPLAVGCAIRTWDLLDQRGQSLVRILGTASLLVLLWEAASELRLQASDALVAAAVLLPTAMRDFAVAVGILLWLANDFANRTLGQAAPGRVIKHTRAADHGDRLAAVVA